MTYQKTGLWKWGGVPIGQTVVMRQAWGCESRPPSTHRTKHRHMPAIPVDPWGSWAREFSWTDKLQAHWKSLSENITWRLIEKDTWATGSLNFHTCTYTTNTNRETTSTHTCSVELWKPSYRDVIINMGVAAKIFFLSNLLILYSQQNALPALLTWDPALPPLRQW